MTHDHDVIDEVATRIWHFEKGKIEDFKGTYEDYLIQQKQRRSRLPDRNVAGMRRCIALLSEEGSGDREADPARGGSEADIPSIDFTLDTTPALRGHPSLT